MVDKRIIAFYLPQYHPFPENDEWWGKGFTEWRNVVKARPLYRGHYQPHLPADLGFYDLRVPEVRQQQADMARMYGINGFCYYHYWFNGHQLMERPLEEMLSSGNPDFPFMLCWANENWTRAWDGGSRHILIAQNYSEEDDRAHIRYLLDNVFSDSRLTPAAVLVLLLVFDWRFGLISLIPMAVGTFFLSRMMGTGMAECMRQYQNALEDMNNEAVEYVRGIPVVKTFQQSIFSFKSFHDSIMRYKNWAVNYTLSLRIPMCCYSVSINGIFAVLIPAGLLLAGDAAGGQDFVTTALDLVFYILFTPVCVTMMDKIMWTSENTMAANDAMERILNVIREKPLPEPAVSRKPENHTIEIKDVSFSYNKDGVNALEHVSLTVPQGAATAMVGASGSGKTTLVSLIPRFFDVDQGSICIGGVDVRDIGTKELMKQVSFVFQDSHLFKDSLLNNIRAAKPEADKEEVMKALKAARCEDIIEKMPQGLDTVVGTKGVYLSGGEMQRIALARAILKDAPIVLLDEATAFADPDNEYLIQQAFEKLVEGKTVIMIAHRLSTVCRAHRIFVMEEGRVAEQGSHDELLKARGLYARMWKDYQTSVEWKVGGKA